MNPIEELRQELKATLEAQRKDASDTKKEIIDAFLKQYGLKTGEN